MVDQTLHFSSKRWWKCEILSYQWVIYLKRMLSSFIIHFQVEKVGFFKRNCLFSKFLIFAQKGPPFKYQRSLKISKGGTLLCKNKKFQKNIFFLQKSYFFYLKMNYTWTELSFKVYNSFVAQNFTFSSFFA